MVDSLSTMSLKDMKDKYPQVASDYMPPVITRDTQSVAGKSASESTSILLSPSGMETPKTLLEPQLGVSPSSSPSTRQDQTAVSISNIGRPIERSEENSDKKQDTRRAGKKAGKGNQRVKYVKCQDNSSSTESSGSDGVVPSTTGPVQSSSNPVPGLSKYEELIKELAEKERLNVNEKMLKDKYNNLAIERALAREQEIRETREFGGFGFAYHVSKFNARKCVAGFGLSALSFSAHRLATALPLEFANELKSTILLTKVPINYIVRTGFNVLNWSLSWTQKLLQASGINRVFSALGGLTGFVLDSQQFRVDEKLQAIAAGGQIREYSIRDRFVHWLFGEEHVEWPFTKNMAEKISDVVTDVVASPVTLAENMINFIRRRPNLLFYPMMAAGIYLIYRSLPRKVSFEIFPTPSAPLQRDLRTDDSSLMNIRHQDPKLAWARQTPNIFLVLDNWMTLKHVWSRNFLVSLEWLAQISGPTHHVYGMSDDDIIKKKAYTASRLNSVNFDRYEFIITNFVENTVHLAKYHHLSLRQCDHFMELNF